VLDSVTSRGNAADKRAAASSTRSGGGRPPRSKAEKRADSKAAKARARALEKRRQNLTVGGAAAVVLALVVGLVLWISNSSSPESTSTAAGPADSVTESGSAFPPLPPGADPALGTKPVVTAGEGTVTELKKTTLIEGKGAAVQQGQTITVNYVGVNYGDGKEFDASWKGSKPFSFAVGTGGVIQGWDQGLLGVKVGSRVQLDIPSAMAYGDNPGGGRPAGALRFVVDVLSAA
jgi:peptidylprolyl isomerase